MQQPFVDYFSHLLMAHKIKPCGSTAERERRALEAELVGSLVASLMVHCHEFLLPVFGDEVCGPSILQFLECEQPCTRTTGQYLRYLAELSDRRDMYMIAELGPDYIIDDSNNPVPPEQLYPHLTRGSILDEFSRTSKGHGRRGRRA